MHEKKAPVIGAFILEELSWWMIQDSNRYARDNRFSECPEFSAVFGLSENMFSDFFCQKVCILYARDRQKVPEINARSFWSRFSALVCLTPFSIFLLFFL